MSPIMSKYETSDSLLTGTLEERASEFLSSMIGEEISDAFKSEVRLGAMIEFGMDHEIEFAGRSVRLKLGERVFEVVA